MWACPPKLGIAFKTGLACNPSTRGFMGPVLSSSILLQLGVIQENRHRVMDLRAGKGQACDPPAEDGEEALDVQQPLLGLMVGSQVAAEARAALKVLATPLPSSVKPSGNHHTLITSGVFCCRLRRASGPVLALLGTGCWQNCAVGCTSPTTRPCCRPKRPWPSWHLSHCELFQGWAPSLVGTSCKSQAVSIHLLAYRGLMKY